MHGMLRANFRERRGVITLHGVPPAVGFALLNYFARPRAGTNPKGAVYTKDHLSYKQGTSAGKTYHFIKFAYDNMADVGWAFPLDDYYPKTCVGPVRLVTSGRFNDCRVWGTPCLFKYKWAVQKVRGEATMGVHCFTVSGNIGHIGMSDGMPRFNNEYGRWVAEQQLEHILSVKSAVKRFPVRPLKSTHKLHDCAHPLLAWAVSPTPMPVVAAAPVAEGDTDEEDDDDDDEVDIDISDGQCEGGDSVDAYAWVDHSNTSDECPCVGCQEAQLLSGEAAGSASYS